MIVNDGIRNEPYYNGRFPYGFIITVKNYFRTIYVARNDRVIFDWIMEPVPEDEFVGGLAKVVLPTGYFFQHNQLYSQYDVGWLPNENISTKAIVGQENPTLDKALAVVRGRNVGMTKYMFDEDTIPPERVFHLFSDESIFE